MIVGIVNEYYEAIIRLVVSGPNKQKTEIDAVIDTGFNGSMSLPTSLIAKLKLPFRSRGRAELADGSESIFNSYEATIIWDGQPHRIAIDEANTDPLIGMSLLRSYELNIQVVNGGNVLIKILSGS